MASDRPAGRPNAHVGDASARMKGQAVATATRPSGPPPGKAPKSPRDADVETTPGALRMVEPSPETRAYLDKMVLERGWHGGDRDADGGLTPDRFDVDQKQRRRYYPAACAVAWFHESARYWALVAMLRSQGDHSERSKEIEAMARRAYELGYAWMKGALSGLPEYDSWQEEPSEAETAGDAP